jgi:hypothetical protein
MREIKFELIYDNGWDNKIVTLSELCGLEPLWAVERQFTGLTDKNGKDIYEGDIIVESDFINDRSMFTVVEYGHFDNDYGDIFGFKITSFFESDKVEVIGNIYENPTLITNTPNSI